METLHIVKERIAASNEAAAKRAIVASKNTLAVAAAAACGAKVREYTRVIEGNHNVVTFALEEKFLEFRPDFAAENVSVGEFLRRIRDDAWVAANLNHHMAYIMHSLAAYRQIVRNVYDKPPLVKASHPRNSWEAFLSPIGDREYQRKLLSQAKFSNDQIEQIFAQLDGIR